MSRSSIGLTVVIALVACAGWFVLRPVCVPLTADDIAQFTLPIEQRTDRDLYLRVFQYRQRQWYLASPRECLPRWPEGGESGSRA